MSYEQFVRYKQQLRAITSEFLKAANMLNDDQLEIVVARMVDRVCDDPDRAFQDKYRGLVLAILLEMRQSGQLRQVLGILDKEKIKTESGNYWHREAQGKWLAAQQHNQALGQKYKAALDEWKQGVGFFDRLIGNVSKPRPTKPRYDLVPAANTNQAYLTGRKRWSEYLIDKVSDFPIVPNEKRPADKTPEDCTPNRDEIKRLTYQG